MQTQTQNIQRPTFSQSQVAIACSSNDSGDVTSHLRKNAKITTHNSKKSLNNKKSKTKSDSLKKIDDEIQALQDEINHWEQNGCINDYLRDTLARKQSVRATYIKNCNKQGVTP